MELPDIKKVISKIKAVIDSIKAREQVFVDDKSSHSNKITLMKKSLDDKFAAIRMIKLDKNALKEDFYRQMIEFELQQLLLRDIDWLQ